MKRFTDAGRMAIVEKNLYAGLSLALMIPDICTSLEDPGPGKSQARYIRWCKAWVEAKFTSPARPNRPAKVFVSAEDCFQLRCSLVHSGRSDIEPKKQNILQRFEFFDDSCGSHLNWVEGTVLNGVPQPNYLQLKVDKFSLTMFDAADEWDASVTGDQAIQAEKAKLLVIHSQGTSIGGIDFG